MSSLATALRSEIVSVTRAILRDEARLLKAEAATRAEVAALRLRVDTLERLVASLQGHAPRTRAAGVRRNAVHLPSVAEPDPAASTHRFSAKGFAKLRQRLGISAAAMGALIGVTAQSIYKWEDGKARPRASQLRAIAEVRKLGKREAAIRLAELDAA
jgi:DNA-binding transcriptional regulator YiaG